MEKIDICMMTKNSANKIFKQSLVSILASDISINRFIVIDGGSTDSTQEIIKCAFPKNHLIVEDKGNLATARTNAIRLVETEWFAFIDSDVIIPKNWYSQICHYKQFGDGLESWNWNWDEEKFGATKTKKGLCQPSSRHHSDRARTIADLIKTKYVKGIKIPSDLFLLEDEYLRRYLEKKGGIWLKTGVHVDHYPHEWNVSPFTNGYLRGKYDFCSQKSLLIKAFGNMIFRKKKSSYYWKMWLGYLWGKLHEL